MQRVRTAPSRTALARTLLALLAATLLSFGASASAAERIYTGLFSNTAVGGYDTVAYFTDGKPVKGSREFTTEWMGAEWRFASQEHLDAFVADPERYAPRYGGYCAWAVSQGYTASGDPEHWAIVDDRLYLNYDASVQRKWDADRPTFIRSANENWPKVVE
ncbi:MAG TPA: YHS domain-containing (seleno)protein [Pseudomonadales bacterium]|nr:YHS domain-containing (seleno)protein [Pseudomonadales bacterium]